MNSVGLRAEASGLSYPVTQSSALSPQHFKA